MVILVLAILFTIFTLPSLSNNRRSSSIEAPSSRRRDCWVMFTIEQHLGRPVRKELSILTRMSNNYHEGSHARPHAQL